MRRNPHSHSYSYSLVVTALLVTVAVLALGSLATLVTETIVAGRPAVVVGVLLFLLAVAIALGSRSTGRLRTPYW